MSYLNEVLQKYYVNNTYLYNEVLAFLRPTLTEWGNTYIRDIFLSGSSAKGTSIKGKSDIDIFISIKHECPTSCEDIYDTLYNKMVEKNFHPRKQNVSIGIDLNKNGQPINVDLVPAKAQPYGSSYHWLYQSKTGRRTQTNVSLQINTIQKSFYQDVIKLVKIWRNCHSIECPSVLIEFATINALKYNRAYNIEEKFAKVLNYFATDFIDDIIIDPGNSANIISNELNRQEKLIIQKIAVNCLNNRLTLLGKLNWRGIIW